MKILINYSNDKYLKQQKLNTNSGKKYGGFDKVIEYDLNNLGKDFLDEHSDFLKENERGGGYWIWKPYIILNTLLNEASEGDYVFYCDSGSMFVNSIDYLIRDLETSNQDLLLTEIPLLEYQWTKKECFIELDCLKEEYVYSNQIQSGFILIKKTENTIDFFKEYLLLCTKYELINDTYDKQINKDLIDHRHDQSILSLLAKKRGYQFFRDISQYGFRPWQYTAKGRDFSIVSYSNSNYPQIVSLYRKDKWWKVYFKEKLKNKLGFKLKGL